MRAASLNTIDRRSLEDDKQRLIKLCAEVTRTRHEHRRQCDQIAEIAIAWKDRLPHGEFQHFMRECGFNLKTLDKWMRRFRSEQPASKNARTARGSQSPIQVQKPQLEVFVPKQGGRIGSSQSFDPDAELASALAAARDSAPIAVDVKGDEDASSLADDIDAMDGDDDEVSGDVVASPRKESSVTRSGVVAAAPLRSATRETQLTLDEIYVSASRNVTAVSELISTRRFPADLTQQLNNAIEAVMREADRRARGGV